MKKYRFLIIICLVVSVMACNFPLSLDVALGVSSVAVSPHSGSGQFHVNVQGAAGPGKSTLTCFISVKSGNNIEVFRQDIINPTDIFSIRDSDPFEYEFSYNYTEPGAHSLVCWLDEKTKFAWSDDFVVTIPETPTPTVTPTLTPMPTATATVSPLFTLNGTFKFAESYNICPDQSRSLSPAMAFSGTLLLTVDYSTGVATATLEGSSGDVVQATCGDLPSTIRYDLAKSTKSGTIDPKTGALDLTGDVKYGFWNSCFFRNGSDCTAQGQSDLTVKVTMNGTLDLSKHIATGKIKRGENDNWGDWQATE